MSEIFNETNMKQAMENYIPSGEVLLAGIHAVAKETEVTGAFGNCICMQDRLIPSENGKKILLSKKKYSAYDVYFGITQSSFVIVNCENSNYLYQFSDIADENAVELQNITSELLFDDIGTCFSLADIQSCDIKKGWMGSVKCFITMKNGNYFKLMFPKLGGLGGGMPHHSEYRDAIIARLSKGSE